MPRRFASDANRAGRALFALPSILVILAVGCGSSDQKPSTDGAGGAAAGRAGAVATGGATSAGGAANAGGRAGAGGDPSVCHPSNFSTAPLECPQDWSHAKAKYPAQCKMDGGYQARCDPYDAILYDAGGKSVSCFYETGTGNLIGARSTLDAASTCVAFDMSFTEPERATCVPAAGGCSGNTP